MKILNKKALIFYGLLCLLIFIYQNCEELTGIGESSSTLFRNCKIKSSLFIGSNEEGGSLISGQVDPYLGRASAEENYNYSDGSAHPIVGPEPMEHHLNVFFYRNSTGFYFNFFVNKDRVGGEGGVFQVDINVQNNLFNDKVIFSDDTVYNPYDVELKKIAPGFYEGRFGYPERTDGGVIGPIEISEDFVLSFKIIRSVKVTNARFYSGNGESFSLLKDDGGLGSFVVYVKDVEDCESH